MSEDAHEIQPGLGDCSVCGEKSVVCKMHCCSTKDLPGGYNLVWHVCAACDQLMTVLYALCKRIDSERIKKQKEEDEQDPGRSINWSRDDDLSGGEE